MESSPSSCVATEAAAPAAVTLKQLEVVEKNPTKESEGRFLWYVERMCFFFYPLQNKIFANTQ